MVATLCSQAIHHCPTGFDRDVQRAARWILQHDNQQKGIVTPTTDCHFDRTPSPGRRIVTDGFTHRDRDGNTLQRNTTHHESRSRRKPLLAYNGLRDDLDDLSGQCAPTAPTRMDAIAHVALETGFACMTFTRSQGRPRVIGTPSHVNSVPPRVAALVPTSHQAGSRSPIASGPSFPQRATGSRSPLASEPSFPQRTACPRCCRCRRCLLYRAYVGARKSDNVRYAARRRCAGWAVVGRISAYAPFYRRPTTARWSGSVGRSVPHGQAVRVALGSHAAVQHNAPLSDLRESEGANQWSVLLPCVLGPNPARLGPHLP